MLIRSGRISAGEWDAALCADALTRPDQPAIVTRGSIDEAELHEILVATIWDGTFAAVAGEIDECIVGDEPNEQAILVLPVDKGAGPAQVLAETTDRLNLLASLPVAVSSYRDHVVAAGAPKPRDAPTALRQEIIEQADGRRNARDIAFAIGRSVHEITVEISRMCDAGLVNVGPRVSAIVSAPGHRLVGSALRTEH